MNEHVNDDPGRLEHLERLIGLELDGRLSEPQTTQLERMRSGSEQARELTATMRSLRAALRAAPAPLVPEGLRDKILLRVEQARTRVRVETAVLPLVRRLALAAAVLLVAGLFALTGGISGFTDNQVSASPSGVREEPTVEDDLRAHPSPDGSLLEYLRWRLLRREP